MPQEFTGLHGRVAIVTGAGRMRSIGRQITIALARAGCDLVVTGTGRPANRYPEDEQQAGWRDIDSVADEVRALGRRALPVIMDVTDEGEAETLVERVLTEFGRLDFLVNNAAAARGADRVPVVEMPVEEWDKVIRVNVRGTFLMSRAFARLLLREGQPGAIVNISSIAGKIMPPSTTAYGASKAAVQALTAGMAHEVGPQGIRINAICPGIIDTSRLDDVARDSERWTGMMSRIPLRRPGDGTEIGHMTAFLLSDQGAWITGQSINVDGGQVVMR